VKNEAPQTVESVERWVNVKIHEWLGLMEAEDFVSAAKLSIDAIHEHCRRSTKDASVPFRQFHFGVRVALNALRDLANIKIIVADDRWLSVPEAVETVWGCAHDARDRLVGYSGLDAGFLAYCLDELNPLFAAIESRYGFGLYMSWELVLDGYTCSICNSDVRGCEHISGRWYGEQECRWHSDGGYIRAVSLVQNPRDPRCRIWPWLKRRNENGHIVIEEVPIYIIFTPEGDDDGGEIIDAVTLFRNGRKPTGNGRATASVALDAAAIEGKPEFQDF